ncbi:MAG: hypothetical protein WBP56_00245 [Polyangia bacterium]
MATSDDVTEADFIEGLVLDEAWSRKLVQADDPGISLMRLKREAKKYLAPVRATADEHVTRDLFAHIQATPRLFTYHEQAIRPPSAKVSPEKRRQYVHQRLGRFAKQYLGRKSLGEVLLPPGSGALIRSYTRLGK